MKMDAVKSKSIAAIGYDHATKTLGVQFKSGGVYHYHGVQPHEHAAFVGADSHGKHFAKHVAGKFKFKKQ